MKLKAEVDVSNRTLAIHNMSNKNKDAHAMLQIGRKPKGLKQTPLKPQSTQVNSVKTANKFNIVKNVSFVAQQ